MLPFRRWSIPGALLLTLSGCNVTLLSFNVPSRVWAGHVFAVHLAGWGTGVSGAAGAVLQVPSGFVVEGAAVRALDPGTQGYSVLGTAQLARDTITGLLAPEPGCYLASFVGGAVPTLNTGLSLELEVYLRAPQASGGPFVLKTAVAGDNGSGFQVMDPPGASSFAAITTPPYVGSLTVVPDPVLPFTMDTSLLVGNNGDYQGVALGDVDGDGNDDLAVAANSWQLPGPATGVWLTRSGGAWIPRHPPQETPAERHFGVAFGDFDGDGHLDLVDTAGRVLFGDGGNSWTPGPPLVVQGVEWYGVATGDVDGDGLDDIVFTAYRQDIVQVLRSVGNRTFVDWSTGLPANSNYSGFFNGRAVLRDVTGDGICDLLDTTRGIWRGDGHGNWVAIDGLNSGVTADFDRDGRMDVLGTITSNTVTWKTYVAGSWQQRTVPCLLGTGEVILAVASIDYDRDGWPDLVLALFQSRQIVLLRNLAGQAFSAPVPVADAPVLSNVNAFAVGDLDGDGWPDLVAVTTGEQPLVWRNLGSGLAPFGSPCSAPGFPVPTMSSAGILQRGSTTFQFELQGMQPLGVGLLWLGESRRFAFGQPVLPYDLGPAGAPGCSLVASPDAPFFVVGDPAGRARLPLLIPNHPQYQLVSVFAQGAMLAPGANALGCLFSGGLAARIP